MKHGYKISINRKCVQSEREDKQWGSWSETWSNSLGRMLEKTEEHPDVVSIHDFKHGDPVLVVWVEWNSGDSFGHGVGSCSEVIGVFKDAESAKLLKKELEKTDRNINKYHIKTPDGQVFKSEYCPWNGYFDSLNSVNMDLVLCF